MPATYFKIASTYLSSAASSVTFSGIPSNYKDLVLRYTIRTSFASTNVAQARLTFNGNTSSHSRTTLGANGTSVNSGRATAQANFEAEEGSPSASNTADVFGYTEIYIPNYTLSVNKAFFAFAVGENFATAASRGIRSGLWQNTSAISSLTLTANAGNFVTGCSFYLYGIE